MYFQQFYLGCLAHASYLIADEASGVAVVVDPQRDIAPYLEAARRHGFRIEHVFLTHFHADFVAGHVELRERVGATIHLSANARTEFDFQPAREGEPLELGKVRLEFLETPGHTNEAISILVYDLPESEEQPHAVLTGDTLFIGDVGRPDLMASAGITAEELAALLYDSLHEKLLKLPDETLVYPAHGAGSLCGKQLSTEKVSTIGEQRRNNYALQPMTKAEFVALVTAHQPAVPPYFGFDAALNRMERPTLDATLEKELIPLSLESLLYLRNGGAQVLDVREPEDFAVGHLAGSLHIPLSTRYATWAGFLLDRSRPVILVTQPGREREAALRLGRIGYDIVGGYLKDGLEGAGSRPDLLAHVKRIAPGEAHELATTEPSALVVDVRTENEWSASHIEGSVNIPLQQLTARIDELPRDRPLSLHCQTGERSSMAASVLLRAGFDDVRDMAGGLDAWIAAGLEVNKAETQVA